MARITVTVTGNPQRLVEIAKQIQDNRMEIVGGPIYEEANAVMTLSKSRVPYLDGFLEASGTVSPPELTSDGVEVKLSYGGVAAPYAILQHENPEFRHKEGRTWKYLENPMLESIEGMANRLGTKISARLARLSGNQ